MDIQRKLMEILDQITEVNKLHPDIGNLQKCDIPNCNICAELEDLGRQYEQLITAIKRERKHSPVRNKIKDEIFKKGENVTKSEIVYLIEEELMSKAEIAKALGVNYNSFMAACRGWKIGMREKGRKTG